MITGLDMDRRNLLKWSAIVPLAAAAPYTALAAVPQGVDALVIDRRHWPAGTPTPLAGLAAPQLFTIDGDVTQLWYQTLDPIWRKPGFVLGGVTGSDALFVLEVLAGDRGRRVTQRRVLDPVVAGLQPVSWIIAPHHPSVKG
ncbi:hypothetical protein GRI97_17200 [Altererythrobacter xixiisoli]|uniref:Uncharacterized protein n=1 Tax=Croceibacterium xixiisoli TaxID=1476466 RepID=A0A6I4U058_9SPHN|nr:hypothetical protein [Croceibacterium xixiisoli]MXP00730.1 hypothetical protein [Croceibacterium xixiisoli]